MKHRNECTWVRFNENSKNEKEVVAAYQQKIAEYAKSVKRYEQEKSNYQERGREFWIATRRG